MTKFKKRYNSDKDFRKRRRLKQKQEYELMKIEDPERYEELLRKRREYYQNNKDRWKVYKTKED